MVHSLAGTIRVVFWAVILIILMMTVWSIIAVDVINPVNVAITEPDDDCRTAFQTVFNSNLALLQTIVAGDSFGKCAMPLMREKPWTVLYFGSVLATVGLGALNLILSAIVDRAQEVRADNDTLIHLSKINTYEKSKQKLEDICATELDSDNDGKVALADLLDALENIPDFANALSTMGLGKAELYSVFYMMDEGHSGLVAFTDWAENLLKLKTEDEHMLLVLIKQFIDETKHTIQQEFELMKVEQKEIQDIGKELSQFVGTKSNDVQTVCEEERRVNRSSGALKVQICSATNLRNADFVGKSDPYVAVELRTKSGTRRGDAHRTSHKMDTLEPLWDETAEFQRFDAADRLFFEVMDKDPTGKSDDRLGKAYLDVSQVLAGFSGSIMLTDAGSTQGKAKLLVKVDPPSLPMAANGMQEDTDTQVTQGLGLTGKMAMPDVAKMNAKSPLDLSTDQASPTGYADQAKMEQRVQMNQRSLTAAAPIQHVSNDLFAELQESSREIVDRLQAPGLLDMPQRSETVHRAGQQEMKLQEKSVGGGDAIARALLAEPERRPVSDDSATRGWSCCRQPSSVKVQKLPRLSAEQAV
jgi:hypothetical protein